MSVGCRVEALYQSKEKYLNILAIGMTVLVQTTECQPEQVSTPWSSLHWVKEEAEMEVTQLTGCQPTHTGSRAILPPRLRSVKCLNLSWQQPFPVSLPPLPEGVL